MSRFTGEGVAETFLEHLEVREICDGDLRTRYADVETEADSWVIEAGQLRRLTTQEWNRREWARGGDDDEDDGFAIVVLAAASFALIAFGTVWGLAELLSWLEARRK